MIRSPDQLSSCVVFLVSLCATHLPYKTHHNLTGDFQQLAGACRLSQRTKLFSQDSKAKATVPKATASSSQRCLALQPRPWVVKNPWVNTSRVGESIWKIRKLKFEIIQYKLKTKATTKRIENPKHISVLSLEPPKRSAKTCPWWHLAACCSNPKAWCQALPRSTATSTAPRKPTSGKACSSKRQQSTLATAKSQTLEPGIPQCWYFGLFLFRRRWGGGSLSWFRVFVRQCSDARFHFPPSVLAVTLLHAAISWPVAKFWHDKPMLNWNLM